MKIALVVDDLIQRGGQEKLVTALSEIWPEAPIYTFAISDFWKDFYIARGVKVITSGAQNIPFINKLNRALFFTMIHSRAFESFDLKIFDVVLSISSRFAHHVITKPNQLHICYMNSPGRMIWEPHIYFENEFKSLPPRFAAIGAHFVKYPLTYIRLLDFAAAQKVDYFIANAKIPKSRIKKYYLKHSDIIYPFFEELKPSNIRDENSTEPYFLVISRLVGWKRIDIAIEACRKLGFKLKIIGEGPDKKRLEKIADTETEFMGFVTEEKKADLIKGCSAMIVTQKEDFGIVPLEAMSLGKPVIAFGEGGSLETVVAGATGEFFQGQTDECLASVLRAFDSSSYDRDVCIGHAQKFSKEIFVRKVKNYVQAAYKAKTRTQLP